MNQLLDNTRFRLGVITIVTLVGMAALFAGLVGDRYDGPLMVVLAILWIWHLFTLSIERAIANEMYLRIGQMRDEICDHEDRLAAGIKLDNAESAEQVRLLRSVLEKIDDKHNRSKGHADGDGVG